MKRSLKNIIMIAIIISLGICSYFTMKGTNSNQTTNKGEIQQAQGTPPGNSNNMETPPEKPTGDTNSNNTGTPPEMPTGNTNASNMGTPPNQAQNGTQNPNSQTKIKTNKIIILGIEGLAIAILITYIALSKFNKLTLKETLKSTETKIIFIAITILLTTILTIGQIYIAQNIINKTNNTENTQMMPQEINNSSQTAEATGEKTITGETDQAGIMIYQSMSGDAGEGTGTFTATNSNLSIQANSKYYKTAPMFFITNTDAIINLKNCQLTYGSNTLISNKGTTEWGTTGTINGEQTAKQIDIKIDSNTKIKLTGNSYITSLEDEDTTYSNIDFNEYTLYVNGTAIN